jgi:hypothetical protein
MIGTSSYVTSMKKGRAIGGCLCSGSGGGGVTSLNGETGAITIIGTGDTTVTNVGPVFTINSSGGSGGLFLPLAGGNMDASPAGVIGAHTISGLTTLESDNAGNDLSILTQPGGSDINIDATASSGFVNVDAYSTTITTGTGAGAEVDIRGKVVIQPPAGYSYPDVPQLGGLCIKNWNNTNAALGNTMNACEIDTIGSIGNTNGLNIENILANNTSGFANGININAVDGSFATGVNVHNINARGQAEGFRCSNIVSDTQDSIGLVTRDIISTAAGGYAISCINITGAVSGVGANFISINGPEAIGVIVSSVTSSSTTATGVNIGDVDGPGNATGIIIGNVAGGDIGCGVDVDNVTAKQEAIGYNARSISTDLGDCHGFKALSMSSDAGNCYGAKIDRVVANTKVAYGISVNDVNGTARTYGIYLGPNMTVGSGGTILGFFQEGSAGNKVRNNFDNEISCGSQEDPNTGLSLTIKGNAFYSAQFLNGPGAIVENGGNLIVLKNVGSSYDVALPFDNVQEGHQYTICMTNTGSVTLSCINGLVIIPVNGGAFYTINGITPPDYKMYQAFYTSVSGSGEWYIG